MTATDTTQWRRAARRLLGGALIAAGVIALSSAPAHAATTAKFKDGVLTVVGDGAPNSIEISRDAAGAILVNRGAVAVAGGTPTVTNTTLVQVSGGGGDDVIRLDEAAGPLPRAKLVGGKGRDTLIGGAGADEIYGQAGNDVLAGRGGADLLSGGADDDVLTGGDGDDEVLGGGGNDRMVWNPGDDSDVDEGGKGTDTVEVNGGNGAETFTATADGTRVRFDRTTPAPFSLDIGTSEKLVVHAHGGDDRFSTAGDLAARIGITVDGGTGDDTILGSNGADVLLGSDGTDVIDGEQGNDLVVLGAGDDTVRWDPGDGNDRVEGSEGTDTMVVNGDGTAETFEASANGERLRFTRDVGAVALDVDGIELVDVHASGNADSVIVGDLTGTDVIEVNADLAATGGGSAGDAAADSVVVNGTAAADVIDVFGTSTSATVVGLAARVDISNADGPGDALAIATLGGNDSVAATTVPAGGISLTVDGGAGDDRLLGTQGADRLFGGDGNDFIHGDNGADVVSMGAGDDVAQWDPGDGSDTVEGQDGADTLRFSGSNANEDIDITANGPRVRLFRDIAGVTMDLDDVERIDLLALGGADDIVVGDLTGTDVTAIGADLRGPNGGGDGQADTITVDGTEGADAFGAMGGAGGVTVFGLHTEIGVFLQDPALDRLTLDGRGSDDVVDATSLEAGGMRLTLDGGPGADDLLGSAGDDLIDGGEGDDQLYMGAGNDTFLWSPGDGDDQVEGQAGFDTMQFTGSGDAEHLDLTTAGERVRLVRDIGDVTTDLDDVERIDVRALGGADTLSVGDLAGTDVTRVHADLAVAGTGDLVRDEIVVTATDWDDTVVVSGDASGTTVFGLAAQVSISGTDPANDRLTIHALAGNDVVDASALAATAVRFRAFGGDGADILIGGAGDDELYGGAGDDVLLGGPGIDLLDGGEGQDVEIQD
jgi:Ca2+-binding RTX toxin-like protein